MAKDKSELSAVEQQEAAAQAKREAVVTPVATPAQAAMPVAPASDVKPEPKPAQSLRIVFDAKTGQTKRGARYLATAQLLGCFGSAPVTVGGFVLALDGRDIAVYMPGSQYSRDIRPRQILIDGGPIEVAGKLVTHRDDPAGTKALVKLEQSIRDAWATANATAEPFGKEITLTL